MAKARLKWVRAAYGPLFLYTARLPFSDRRLHVWSDGKWSLWEGYKDMARDYVEPANTKAGKTAATAKAKEMGWL